MGTKSAGPGAIVSDMAWFDRHAGEDPTGFAAELDECVAASGVVAALSACAGLVGLRRFVVRFDVREGRAKVVDLDAPRLPRGGGPPPSATFDAGISELQASMGRLWKRLPARARFTEVAAGFVRSAGEEPVVSFRFDEDAKGFVASGLAEPKGACALLEEPAYLAALASWTARIDEVRGYWRVARGDWMFESGRLDDGERMTVAIAIGTWHESQQRFSWFLATPAGEEGPFVEPDVPTDLGGAMELAAFAAARLGCIGVFSGSLDNGQQFFAGIKP